MKNKTVPGARLVVLACFLFAIAFATSVVGAFGTFGIIENDPEVKYFFDWLRTAANHLMIASVAAAVVGIGLYLTRKEVK